MSSRVDVGFYDIAGNYGEAMRKICGAMMAACVELGIPQSRANARMIALSFCQWERFESSSTSQEFGIRVNSDGFFDGRKPRIENSKNETVAWRSSSGKWKVSSEDIRKSFHPEEVHIGLPGYLRGVEDAIYSIGCELYKERDEDGWRKEEIRSITEKIEDLQHLLDFQISENLKLRKKYLSTNEKLKEVAGFLKKTNKNQEPTYLPNIKITDGYKVYVLSLNGVCVYIGQTSQRWPFRLSGHGDKVFNSADYIDCSNDSVNAVEMAGIGRFNPIYNNQGDKTGAFKTSEVMSFLHELTIQEQAQ